LPLTLRRSAIDEKIMKSAWYPCTSYGTVASSLFQVGSSAPTRSSLGRFLVRLSAVSLFRPEDARTPGVAAVKDGRLATAASRRAASLIAGSPGVTLLQVVASGPGEHHE
jgi:hypothetical protein